jgi:hypothetical protein
VEGEALAARKDPDELPRRAVAEHGAGTAGEDGGEPPSLLGDLGVADRVDAAVEPVEVAAPDQSLDPIDAEAGIEELAASDNAVLAGGDRRYRFH